MKKIEFNLTFEVHKKMDEENFEILLKDYLINDYNVEKFVTKVISEEDEVDNFLIKSVDLVRKKKIKKNDDKISKNPDLVGEQWNAA